MRVACSTISRFYVGVETSGHGLSVRGSIVKGSEAAQPLLFSAFHEGGTISGRRLCLDWPYLICGSGLDWHVGVPFGVTSLLFSTSTQTARWRGLFRNGIVRRKGVAGIHLYDVVLTVLVGCVFLSLVFPRAQPFFVLRQGSGNLSPAFAYRRMPAHVVLLSR